MNVGLHVFQPGKAVQSSRLKSIDHGLSDTLKLAQRVLNRSRAPEAIRQRYGIFHRQLRAGTDGKMGRV